MSETQVILVNEQDEQQGLMEKMEAHRRGLLHRAFSVVIFNAEGHMLLQQRAGTKYHGGLLWTNACCSHPLPGEAVEAAAERRLQEELGFCTPLKKAFSFTYKASVEHGLIEHEFDHVFVGEYNDLPLFNSEEVAAVAYHTLDDIATIIQQQPDLFTSWFKLLLPQVQEWWQQHRVAA